MLILTRKINETIDAFYTDETGTERKISMMVIELSGNSVRLGIDAPRDVLLLRREVRRNNEKGE